MSFTLDSEGLYVPDEMYQLLKRNPGYIRSDDGGQRIADLYVEGSANFSIKQLSPFGLACFWGHLEHVQLMVETGRTPDLSGSETPYNHGYAALVVLGAQRVVEAPPGTMRWSEVLSYLLSKGMPPDVEDIIGYTALDHATMNHQRKLDLARYLLSSPHSAGPANVNHRNRRGMTPIWGPMMNDVVDSVDLLMEFGADIEIRDADGIMPALFYVKTGPKITATVRKWLRKRSGEDDVLDFGKCGYSQCPQAGPATSNADIELKMCARCKTIRYCSTTCQRAHWPRHKASCVPFSASASNTVTLKPYYHEGPLEFISLSTTLRNMQGIPTKPAPESHSRAAHLPKGFSENKAKPKPLVIKIQARPGQGPLFVYTKKRHFVCMIRREDDEVEYDRIVAVIRDKGVIGLKAYFAAELQSKDRLVVKIDNVLAEQPF